MKFILFGAGNIGLWAYEVIGSNNIECFADNYKNGQYLNEKKIISFKEMIEVYEQFCIVITSNLYLNEFEKQLQEVGINNYVIFNNRNNHIRLAEVLPRYNYIYNEQFMSYTDILLNYQIFKYKKVVIWGSNKYISYLLYELIVLNNSIEILGIVDEEENRTNIFGIPIVTLSDVEEDIECLIINKRRIESDIREKLDSVDFDIIDIYDIEKFIYYNCNLELKKYKNIHKGKRVFIIGNGPSVKIEDLDTLYDAKEICFGLNKIYKIFSKTNWRPNYTCITDMNVISAIDNDLSLLLNESTVFMADRYLYFNFSKVKDVQYVHLISEEYVPNFPGFSKNIEDGVYLGYSVTYDLALQIAAYMGFAEIYLIGMDHNIVGETTDKRNHFITDYFTEEEILSYRKGNITANFEAINIAYKKAEVYSRKNGFRIFNATRGGKLEIFERVDFDSLF